MFYQQSDHMRLNQELDLHVQTFSVSHLLSDISTFGPGLVDGGFLTEFLRQVIESFQPANLIEEPLFIAFLCSLQVPPGVVDVLHKAKEKKRRVSEKHKSCNLCELGSDYRERAKQQKQPSCWLFSLIFTDFFSHSGAF